MPLSEECIELIFHAIDNHSIQHEVANGGYLSRITIFFEMGSSTGSDFFVALPPALADTENESKLRSYIFW